MEKLESELTERESRPKGKVGRKRKVGKLTARERWKIDRKGKSTARESWPEGPCLPLGKRAVCRIGV